MAGLATAGRPSASQAPSSTGAPLTASELLTVLTNPKVFELRDKVWYAINATHELLAQSPQSTLAGRLGLAPEQLKALLAEVGLGTAKATSWQTVLNLHRTRHPLPSLNVPEQLELFFATRIRIDAATVNFVAFGEQPAIDDPKQQLAYGARQRQPAPLSKTLDAVQRMRQRTPLAISRRVSPPPSSRGANARIRAGSSAATATRAAAGPCAAQQSA